MGKQSRAKRQRTAVTEPIRATSRSDTKRIAAISAALLVSVFTVYGQLGSHDLINVDDPVYVPQNVHVMGGLSGDNIRWAFTSFHAAYWIPLTWISYMADISMFGFNPGKILLTNALLHAVNAILLFLALRRLTGSVWRSAIVAGFFALHPLHVESVAWATERKDVLSTFFFALTLLFYATYVERKSRLQYALALVAFACGLMSKPMVITTPFVLLLLDWWPLKRLSRAAIIEKIPFLALIIPAAILTLKAQAPALTKSPMAQKLATAFVSYVTYLEKTFVPAGLAIIYPLRDIPAATAAIAVVIFLALTAIAIAAWRRFPFVTVGWLWYIGTLVPVIGIVQAGKQAMADRFTYIPLIGIFIAIVWLAGDIAAVRKLAPAAAVILLVACGTASFVQAGYWKDSVTLERHAIAVTKDNDQARVYLGAALFDRGERDAAESEFREAARINPGNDEAWRDLGRIKMRSNPAEAIPLLEKAATAKPNDYATQAMLAAAKGQREQAIGFYQRALAEQDDTPDIRNDYAAILALTGHDQQALEQYEAALHMMPRHYDARMNLGALLSRMGRDDDAAEQFEQAAVARPQAAEPHVYLALVHAQRGRIAAAITEVDTALRMDPNGSNAIFTDAVRIPFKPTNLRDYEQFLQQNAKR